MVAMPRGPADPTSIQPELGTAMDYDQDGRTDVFLHDVYGSSNNWVVLLAQSDHTFKQHDTGIPRPFPLGVSPPPPALTSAGASVHLADLDGDGVPDLISCQDHSEMEMGIPSRAAWTVHLWKPASGSAPAGFDPAGATIAPLAGFRCDVELYTVDINADTKVDLVVASMRSNDVGDTVPDATYSALTRRQDGSWEVFDTKLPLVPPGGHLVWADVNADGLPDAIQSGLDDGMLWTWINTGPTFTAPPVHSLDSSASFLPQDTFLGLAAVLDYNNDGRQDLLVPMPGGTLPGQSDTVPAWAILQATGSVDGPTFELVDPHIPFEPLLSDSISLADPHGPRIGDLNGDATADVLLPLDGVFNVFENQATDQDVLIAVSDGMNAHDPSDPGFVPNVAITYGHLGDASITDGVAAGAPALEGYPYLSHADPANGCAYPIACAVGSHRVVTGYTLNNGADGQRHFGVRYRDGRYHRLGRGFLGFGERIVTDLDTLAGTAAFYDNVTAQSLGAVVVFPFAGRVQHTWH